MTNSMPKKFGRRTASDEAIVQVLTKRGPLTCALRQFSLRPFPPPPSVWSVRTTIEVDELEKIGSHVLG